MTQKTLRTPLVLCGMSLLCVSQHAATSGRTLVELQGLSAPLSIGEQTFENSSEMCIKNDTCDLKKVIFRKEDYLIPPTPSVLDDDTVQSTRVLTGFVTSEIADLTRYSFV